LSTAKDSSIKSRDDVRILTGFTIAHGIFHFMHQSFAVMLPAIKEAFGISPIQIGALMTAKEIAMGVSSLPSGVISDRLKRYRGIIMAACMALFGLSWLLIGMASIYPHLIVGLVFVSIATSVWHLPSMAEISRRFSDRKGASLAIFGIGGSFGDIFGPVITGILLGLLAWQRVISISPQIAGYFYQNWGMTATLFFVAALFAISAFIFASADLTIQSIHNNQNPA